ncbi:MAG: hypothetical protein U0869_25810 [Chloroflexota bacterium]
MPSLPQRARAVLASTLLAAGLVTATAAGAAGAAPALPYLWADFDACHIELTNVGVGVRVNLRILEPNGTERMHLNQTTDVSGGVLMDCVGRLRPGERIVARKVNPATQKLEPLLTFKLPAVRFVMDRVADTITVAGFPGGVLNLFVSTCSLAHRDCLRNNYLDNLPADGSAFKVDTSDDLTGTSFAEVNIGGTQTAVTFLVDAPHLEVTPGSSKVTGAGTGPKSTVKVGARTSANLAKGAGSATTALATNRFSATLLRPNGKPATVVAGDTVSGSFASDARLTLPAALSISATGGVLSGATCLPLQLFAIEIQLPDGRVVYKDNGRADISGIVSGYNYSSSMVSGERLLVLCANGAGDWYTLRSAAQ